MVYNAPRSGEHNNNLRMKRNKIIALAAVACMALTSCSDLLDLYPEDAISDPNFWKSEQDLELFANGFYGILPGAKGPGADDQSDCYVNEKPNTWLFNLETIPTSGGGWSNGDWGNIRSCNYFLARYTQVKGDETKINRSVAMVRFARAWEYVEKIKRFGDVPWYETELQVDSEELYKGRDSRKLVFENILKDLDYAITWLPNPNEVKSGNMHKYAALAYKVRACLYEASYRKYHGLSDYEPLYREACVAAEDIIENGGYSIWSTEKPETDYYNLFIQEDLTSNSECILPRIYITELLTHNNTRQMEESYTGMSRSMFEQYLCADGLPTSVSPGYYEAAMPADELVKRDPRLAQTIDNPGLPYKVMDDGTIQVNELPIIDPKYCTTGYHIMKFHSPDPKQWNIGLSTLDVFIFRYAEVLLSYAEAKAELGECTQEVLDETINQIRNRVGMPKLTTNVGFTDLNWLQYGYTLSPLLHEIRRERSVELLGEGFRWDDIVRWKAGKLLENPKSMLGMKVSDELKSKYESFDKQLTADNLLIVYPDNNARAWNDKLYLRPLPIDETTMNPNLLPNNPGWDN